VSVTEIVGGAMGSWELTLSSDTPQWLLDAIDYFGHIAVTSSRVDPTRYGDGLMDDARYVGVLRTRSFQAGQKTIGGPGISFWIGDEDDKGDVIETEINIVDQTFEDSLDMLLPPQVVKDHVFVQAGLHKNKYKLIGRRAAINYFAELYGVEWRVRGKMRFDIGLPTDLYDPNPRCAVVRGIPGGGIDTDGLRALPGEAGLDADMGDYSTRVVTVGSGDGITVAVGDADINPLSNPYKDFFGQPLKVTRLVSEQNTSLTNADARAQIFLDQFTSPVEKTKLSTRTHDIKGDLECGGYIWVEDQDAKIVGPEAVVFQGRRLYPVKYRITELAWPIESGMGVSYRHWNGTWYDLTPYVVFEDGDTTVTINGYNKPLTTGTSPSDPIAGQVGSGNDGQSPDTPDFIEPFTTAQYLSDQDGLSRAEFDISWTIPLNQVDGTVVTDGQFYQIRYKRIVVP
jgi:hypothetical protein